MTISKNKTKIVATIGPACESPKILERMIRAGMNVARLNFSHGDFSGHKQVIENIRTAARKAGHPVTIMADLPGPKMRIGKLANEPIDLEQEDNFTLTIEDIVGDENRVSVSFHRLTQAVKSGDILGHNIHNIHFHNNGEDLFRHFPERVLNIFKGLNSFDGF